MHSPLCSSITIPNNASARQIPQTPRHRPRTYSIVTLPANRYRSSIAHLNAVGFCSGDGDRVRCFSSFWMGDDFRDLDSRGTLIDLEARTRWVVADRTGGGCLAGQDFGESESESVLVGLIFRI